MSPNAHVTAHKFHHPYDPYEIQYDLMKVVYRCIEEGKIGILESPTGTGKSLSLICSSLTWLRDFQRNQLQGGLLPKEDSDEPQWVLEHEIEDARRAAFEQRSLTEARLQRIRAKELRQRQEYEKAEPSAKRVRSLETDKQQDSYDDTHFELADYASEGEQEDTGKLKVGSDQAGDGLSSTNLELMRKLGLIPTSTAEVDVSPVDEVKVFFCSRTHSQLTQFVQELRRVHLPQPEGFVVTETSSASGDASEVQIKHLPLGSRKNLCINKRVSKLGSAQAITEKCLEMQQPNAPKETRCGFKPNKDNETLVHQFRDYTLARIRDIEDLGSLGQKIGICPYYASRDAINPSEIVTLPYPLLLQKSARETLDISLKGHVVIIDEAHNLMDTIANIHSVTVTKAQLVRCQSQLRLYLQKFRNRLRGKNRVYLAQVIRLVDSISGYLEQKMGNPSLSEGIAAVTDLMAGKGADQIHLHKLVIYLQESKLARKVDGYAMQSEGESTSRAGQTPEARAHTLPVLTHIQSFIQTLANPGTEGRFFYEKDATGGISLKYSLLDPTFHFRAIVEEARAVILVGGTMSPMDDYLRHLLAYVDPGRIQTFSCGHIIPKENLLAVTVGSGASGVEFDFTFEKRTSAPLIEALGRSLVDISGSIPDGVVVFFPSYAYLDCVVSALKSSRVWDELQKQKPIFLESKGTSSVDQILDGYSKAIAAKRGGLLLSVIGGKLSEGINFSDALGRGVVVVGMPFPNIHSAQWKAKLEYIERSTASQTGKVEDGKAAARSFVENACMRAVNQSVGRAIRHKADYAAILLLDKRYGNERIAKKLPAWIQQGLTHCPRHGFPSTVNSLRTFFKARQGT